MTRKVTIKSPVSSQQLFLRAATIVERLGQPFQIELDLLSPDENLEFEKFLGHDMHVAVELDQPGKKRYFHGFIVHFSQGTRVGRYVQYRARAVPWLWFLSRTADCRIFQNKHVPDIVKEVFKGHGFSDVKDALTKTYRTRDYCVQYRETDLNFVQRLMEEEGIYYYFKHEEGKHTVVLADAYSAHECVPDYESVEYIPPSDNMVREK